MTRIERGKHWICFQNEKSIFLFGVTNQILASPLGQIPADWAIVRTVHLRGWKMQLTEAMSGLDDIDLIEMKKWILHGWVMWTINIESYGEITRTEVPP